MAFIMLFGSGANRCPCNCTISGYEKCRQRTMDTIRCNNLRTRQRLDAASAALVQLLLQHETALRAMFRMPADKPPEMRPPLALRTGQRIQWVEDALAPVREKLDRNDFAVWCCRSARRSASNR